ncbi:stAR-related lipid transfer protein 5-like [Ptychodera flava]|uniref:stAR-related lipid transfer protein 5-like n=1 Tax=Ptychodera flava TaxID=63121 RepID=UPI00396A2107
MTTDYKAILDGYREKLLVYEKDTDWKLHKDDGELKLSTKRSREFDGIIYRSDFIFNTSPEKAVELTADLAFVLKINKHLAELEVVESYDDNIVVFRSVSKSVMMGLISPREFINVMQKYKFDDRNVYCVYHGNVEHPKCPEKPDLIRAISYPSGRFIYAIDGEPNKCRVVGFSQSDAKLFPQKLVEQFTPGSITTHIKTTMQLINEGKV